MRLALHNFSRLKNPLRLEEMKAAYRLNLSVFFAFCSFFTTRKKRLTTPRQVIIDHGYLVMFIEMIVTFPLLLFKCNR